MKKEKQPSISLLTFFLLFFLSTSLVASAPSVNTQTSKTPSSLLNFSYYEIAATKALVPCFNAYNTPSHALFMVQLAQNIGIADPVNFYKSFIMAYNRGDKNSDAIKSALFSFAWKKEKPTLHTLPDLLLVDYLIIIASTTDPQTKMTLIVNAWGKIEYERNYNKAFFVKPPVIDSAFKKLDKSYNKQGYAVLDVRLKTILEQGLPGLTPLKNPNDKEGKSTPSNNTNTQTVSKENSAVKTKNNVNINVSMQNDKTTQNKNTDNTFVSTKNEDY